MEFKFNSKNTNTPRRNNKNDQTGTMLSAKHIIVDSVYGYVFWSLFHGLPPMIWFYPLNELDVTGYEVFIAVLLLPIFTLPSKVLSILQNHLTLACLRLVSIASLASFHASTTLFRLIVLSCGTAAALLVVEACLWSPSAHKRCSTALGLLLGFVSLLVSRICYTSVLPTWADSTTNKIVLATAFITVVKQIVSKHDRVVPKDHVKNTKNIYEATSWFRTGIGLGSYLYLTHAVFGEVSIPCRWVVQGYPSTGPYPNPGGVFVLMFVIVGFVLAIKSPQIATSFYWWLTGVMAFAALYYLPTYFGFFGGLVLAVYTFSLWMEITIRATSCCPAKTLTTAMTTYTFEILFSVWTIAYNFVPGGEYTREHTDYLIVVVMLCLGLALLTDTHPKTQLSEELKRLVQTYASFMTSVLLVLMMLGLLSFAKRWQTHHVNLVAVKSSNSKDFSALIWTYHFAYDNEGWPSFERTATLLNDTGADVIALLETDASKPFLGNNDLSMWLSEHLMMHVDFGPSTRDHTWGNMLLSRYPIIQSTHHLLPSPHGELAPAISATVNISGTLVDFVTTHMGNDRDTLDRKLQAEYLSKQLNNSQNPVVFLGYVTSPPGSRDYTQLTNHGRTKDIDSTDYDRWCQYIFYRGLIRLGYARISHGTLSDTEIQLAKFRIPNNLKDYHDNTKVETDPEKIPKHQLFNSKFGSFRSHHYWGNDHQYHMDTPKYFLP